MSMRRAAPLEERLRQWVTELIDQHGGRAKFAKDIARPESWVSTYLGGKTHPDLDTTVRIATVLKVNLDQLTGLHPLPAPDAETQRMYELWPRIPQQLRGGALEVMEGLARIQPVATTMHTAPHDPVKLAIKRRGRR